MKAWWCIVASVACLAAGCGLSSAREQLRTQAVFDLGCPGDQLVFVDLGGNSIPFNGMRAAQGVTGCGKRVSYVYQPQAGAWMKNGAEPAPALSPPAAHP